MSETDPRAEARKTLERHNRLLGPFIPSALVDELVADLRKSLEREEQARNASREAFVAGAAWWEYERPDGGATLWPADRDRAELAAEERFPFAPWAHLRRIREMEEQVAKLTVERDEARAAEAKWRAEASAAIKLSGRARDFVVAALEREERATRERDEARAELARLTTPRCVTCGEAETARGGDLHCTGDCDDAAHDEDGGCHRFIPRPVKPAGTVLVTAAADMSAGALEAGAASELRPVKPEPVHCEVKP